MGKSITRRQALEFVAAASALLSQPSRAGNRAEPATAPGRRMLEQSVGTRDKVAGTIAVVIDDGDVASPVAYGSAGVPSVALDGHTVFEIGSITKVFTALLLTDMAARGDVALDDPLEKYLPPSVRLHEHGRPITLLDLANYNAGLPLLPGNLPAKWWESPNPFADYTEERLYESVSGYTPEYAPGTRFVYSSFGFALLGLALALARRAGKSYEQLLLERVCGPLGLHHTRITLSADMRRHLAQPHDLSLKPTPLWDLGAGLQGAGAARASVDDVTAFLKACMGLVRTPLRHPLARLLETRRPTTVAGTDAALGWFISSSGQEEIAWKSGLTGGFNTFVGFSTRRRRGALVLSNFLWQPLDVGTTVMGMKMIAPDFDPGDLTPLYQ
jgi:serine-type D-Ala-D-Ala carboxypeptidase/endopeptidase